MTEYRDTVILTGATSGIGAAAAARLAPVCRRLVLLGPEPEAAVADPLARLREASAGEVVYVSADFTRLDDVAEAAARLADGPPIFALINDAGIPGSPARRVTADGHERTLQVNYLALVLLSELLAPAIAPGGRLVNVASATHTMTTLGLDDLELERDYSPVRAYARSKLAIILYTRWLARTRSSGPVAVSLNPGVISTGLLHAMFGDIGRPVDQGAAALLAAVDADASGGEYFDEARLTTPSAEARDDALGDALMVATFDALRGRLPH